MLSRNLEPREVKLLCSSRYRIKESVTKVKIIRRAGWNWMETARKQAPAHNPINRGGEVNVFESVDAFWLRPTAESERFDKSVKRSHQLITGLQMLWFLMRFSCVVYGGENLT